MSAQFKVSIQDADTALIHTPSGEEISVLLRQHPRARRIGLSIVAAGPRISSPRGTRFEDIAKFLVKHAAWVEEKIAEMGLPDDAQSKPMVGVEDSFLLRGERQNLRWQQYRFPSVIEDEHGLLLSLDMTHRNAQRLAQNSLRGFLQQKIKPIVAEHCREFEPMLAMQANGVRVLPLKSLWGSLSVQGKVTLDLALMMTPPHTLRYVVAHELCHLRVRNHGPRFWGWVEKLVPDYEQSRVWLRKHGHAAKAELARWIST